MNKRIKLLIIGICLIVFTGCTPEYNLEFKDGKVLEELKMPNVSEEQARNYFTTQFSIPKNQKRYIGSYKNNTASYSYEFDFDNFFRSNIVETCYNAHNFFHKGNSYLFQTGFRFECLPYQVSDYEILNYDNLLVKIKLTNYEVIKHNADEVNNGIYIWNINKDNYENKSISIEFKDSIQKKNKKKEKKKNNSYKILFGIGIVIGISVFILIYGLGLNKRRNKL